MKFLRDKPVLILEKEKTCILADLHLGIEYELYSKGISIPSQINSIQNRIISLINQEKIERLIILGDLKHQIPNTSWQERKEIPKFLSELSNKVEISLVKGNHDGGIEKLVNGNFKIHSGKGFKLKKFYFSHGHAYPSELVCDSEYLIMSHIHPSVEFKDKLGYRSLEKCWVRGGLNKEKFREKYGKKKIKLTRFIIVPAFNSLISGNPINKRLEKNEEYISPLIRNGFLRWDKSRVFLLDGTDLGKIEDLQA